MKFQRDFTLLEPNAQEPTWQLKLEALRHTVHELTAQLQALGTATRRPVERGVNLPAEVRRFEIELIQSALYCTGGHQKRAARLLGLKPTTLNAKLKLYGIVASSKETETWERPSETLRAA